MESETPPEKQENSFNFDFDSERILFVFTDAAVEAYSLAWDLNSEYIMVATQSDDPVSGGLR